MEWSLEELYPSIDSFEFEEDFLWCDERLDFINKWTNDNLNSQDNAKKKIEDFLKHEVIFMATFTKLITYANLSISVNSNDHEALKSFEKLQVMYTRITKPLVSFEEYLSSVNDLDSLIDSSEFLSEHRFYLKEIKCQ